MGVHGICTGCNGSISDNKDMYCAKCAEKGDAYGLKDLGKEIIAINKANGWNVVAEGDMAHNYKIPAILALIHSEVSEALEAFRMKNRREFAFELADIIIRTLDCAAGLGVDMDHFVREKLEKNKQRGYRHGGKRL